MFNWKGYNLFDTFVWLHQSSVISEGIFLLHCIRDAALLHYLHTMYPDSEIIGFCPKMISGYLTVMEKGHLKDGF